MVFALRKFTGGMGDEDEDQPDSNKTWLNYFLKPLGKYSTVWKFQDFSVTQILREINLREFRCSKSAIYAISGL